MPCRFPANTHLALGGSPGFTQGSSWGIWPEEVSRPTPGGCLQAHTRGGYPSMHWGRHPTPSRRLLLRAVRILLECILVFNAANSFSSFLPIGKITPPEESRSEKGCQKLQQGCAVFNGIWGLYHKAWIQSVDLCKRGRYLISLLLTQNSALPSFWKQFAL